MSKQENLNANDGMDGVVQSTPPVPHAIPVTISTPSNYEALVKLPTRGLLYGYGTEDFVIRSMTTSEEKILFGSSTTTVFEKIIQQCIVAPQGAQVADLIPVDMSALLLKLRSHTYGSDYHVTAVCPRNSCKHKHTFLVDLESLPVTYLNEKFEEPLEVELPISKRTLQLKLLRQRDYSLVREQARKIAKRTGANIRELEFIMKQAKMIKQIDGQDVDFTYAQAFYEKLQGMDSAYMMDCIDQAVGNIGIDTVFEVECPVCDEVYEVELAITPEFFRPRFNRTSR